MIIQCKKCETKYKFDESLIKNDGIWVRCGRCNEIFFQERSQEEEIISLTELRAEKETNRIETQREEAYSEIFGEDISKTEKAADQGFEKMPVSPENEIAEESDAFDIGIGEEPSFVRDDEAVPEMEPFDIVVDEKTLTGDEKTFGHFDEIVQEDISDVHEGVATEGGELEKERKGAWSTGKIIAIIAFTIALLLGVSLWIFPDIRTQLFNTVSSMPVIKDFLGESTQQGAFKVNEEAIFFENVRERSVKNWIVGDILVIEGVAINNNENHVSKIKVRGTILDVAGNILDKDEAYAGNILTDEELKNLTQDEITSELANQYGRNSANRDIPHKGKIPFMIVFDNPPEKASEYLIDLAKVSGVLE
ncbi:MAG: zinc-ribbon domain-containing protein [Deltaproteobacteria bacterium]|nr:zinc-ribbon domain-containing protein [Deltaproteobacteria bacterium]